MKKLTMIFVFGFSALMSQAYTASEFGTSVGKKMGVHGDLDQGITFFQGTWQEALKKADKEDKLIFMDAYAEWCGPCKLMARNTFTNSQVGTYFNAEFINYKMDMEKNAEGPRLSRKYSLTAYPTLYFIDKNENIVHTSIGYQEPKDLLRLGQEALKK